VQRFTLWDLPTRLFHWLLALCVTGSLISGELGGSYLVWHGRCGIAVVGLLTFRIVWGVVGSTYARFANFVRGPAAIQAYLQGRWQGRGHNPLGALSVLALLAVLLAMVATGVFGNDDSSFEGPLYALVDKALSDRLSSLHRTLVPLVFALVGLHLAAIVYYVRVRKDNLLKPMLTGWKDGPGENAKGGGIVAFIVAVLLGLTFAYGASGAWIPPPPPPAPASTPSW